MHLFVFVIHLCDRHGQQKAIIEKDVCYNMVKGYSAFISIHKKIRNGNKNGNSFNTNRNSPSISWCIYLSYGRQNVDLLYMQSLKSLAKLHNAHFSKARLAMSGYFLAHLTRSVIVITLFTASKIIFSSITNG